MDIENCILTADAMSCQKTIAAKIVEKHADYVLSVKENQPGLFGDIRDYFAAFSEKCPHNRTDFLETGLDWLEQKNDWYGLKGIGAVSTYVEERGEVRRDTRYYITSLTDIDEFSKAVRGHWGIENNLHWCLDVVFREDASRARKDNFKPQHSAQDGSPAS